MPDIQSNLEAEKRARAPGGFFEKIKGGKREKTETKQEGAVESADKGAARRKVLEEIEEAESIAPGGLAAASSVAAAFAARQKEIEKVLEEDLEEIYIKMPPDKQREFKLAGEETVQKINSLLGSAKFKIKKIINLIKKWLSIIPGINKFFLEQEAKIKADEIIKIKNKI